MHYDPHCRHAKQPGQSYRTSKCAGEKAEAREAEAAGGGAAEVFYLGIDNSLATKGAQNVRLPACTAHRQCSSARHRLATRSRGLYTEPTTAVALAVHATTQQCL